MDLSFLYKILFYVIHTLFNLYKCLNESCAAIRNIILNLIHKYYRSGDVVLQLYNNKINLSKIPRHLTVLLGDEEPSYENLAKLILWSVISGISFISFYDAPGTLKENEDKLHAAAEKQLINGLHIIWHTTLDYGYKNGFTGNKIHVKIYSASDARRSIVHLSKAIEDRQSIEMIGSALQRTYEFPDPELAIYTGDYFNLQGYPPWQIRLTEFLNLKTHHNIRFNQFMHILKRYSKCEQRIGK